MEMTKTEKLKVSNYLRALCMKIMARTWPEDQRTHVNGRVQHFLRTAYKLEAEAQHNE